MPSIENIQRLIAESEPLESFEIDEYADLEELRDMMRHEHESD